ncbi:hypothetical protein [Sporomusa termitida]|uniref:Uncharacterized protein n=1 Tax=Sporomusa termitida TaxID=2377 RepID=A0A517DZR0_9FIRM|nr:hypothetical protein [Sporomusa termitida]QDR82831.1 hypothetical protein SPTER_42700 [Sporomusa termitida]
MSSDKMYVFQVLVEPEPGKNHVQISTEILAKVGHIADDKVNPGIHVAVIDNVAFPGQLLSKARKAFEISICTPQDLNRDWLLQQLGTGSGTFKLVASKNPSLVYLNC